MKTINSGISVSPPSSAWKKNLKFDFKPLFKSLAQAVAHTATLKFDELAKDAAEAAISLDIEEKSEEVAFVLIQNSLFDALLTLTKESFSHLHKKKIELIALGERIEIKLGELSVSIDGDFFKNPAKYSFIKDISKIYADWLVDLGSSPIAAATISARLPAYFVFSLASEWRKNPSHYKQLSELTENPFYLAQESTRGWQLYFSFLRKRVSENIFDEPFCLSQVYIPLNGYYVDKTPGEAVVGPKPIRSEKKVAVQLKEEIIGWLYVHDKSDALRVISGGPGSGKSSLTKVLCCELAESGIVKPIYIPLHLIDPTREIISEIERFVRDEGLLGFNPLSTERSEDKLLLVFDGLDELASMGKAAALVAKDFVQAVERMIERRNLGAHPIFVILSGRELIVQENETEFRKPKQVLTILPYFLEESERRQYKDATDILSKDLRTIWWKNYGRLTGTKYKGVPEQLQISEIDEITAQPLLNYLVALSFRRGKLDFSSQLNLNSVYADLLAAVHDRGYDQSRRYGPIGHISLKDFTRVLEEIGLAAWHGSDGRSTSVKEIMAHCQSSGLEPLLKSFTGGAQAGVTKLLAAFFFRRSGESVGDDSAFVFTHKSFGEYLTAARLVRGLDRIIHERRRRQSNTDEGYDISEALVHWARLSGAAPLTEYIKKFLFTEIAQRSEIELATWQEVLAELLSSVVERHFPIERLGGVSFSDAFRSDVNSATALLLALNASSVAIRRTVKLNFVSETAFGTFLRRVTPQRSGPQSPIIYSALSYFDFSGQCFDLVDLYGANLDNTLWKRCRIHMGNFGSASLRNSNFSEAILSWSRLNDAEMFGATFLSAKLSEVDFCFMSLINVDFQKADLDGATFDSASIHDCSFADAYLGNSTIYECSEVERSSFDRANVSVVDKQLLQWHASEQSAGRVTGSLVVSEKERPFSSSSRKGRRRARE